MADAPDEVQLNEGRSGYTMCFPIAGAVCRDRSPTWRRPLNIDWLLDIAREALRHGRHEVARHALLAGVEAACGGRAAGQALYHPYIFEAGERGPFLDPDARAQFTGLSTTHEFRGPDARRL